MAAVGRLPQVGDSTEHDGFRLEVTEVDGRRAARIRVTPPPPQTDDGNARIGSHVAES